MGVNSRRRYGGRRRRSGGGVAGGSPHIVEVDDAKTQPLTPYLPSPTQIPVLQEEDERKRGGEETHFLWCRQRAMKKMRRFDMRGFAGFFPFSVPFPPVYIYTIIIYESSILPSSLYSLYYLFIYFLPSLPDIQTEKQVKGNPNLVFLSLIWFCYQLC